MSEYIPGSMTDEQALATLKSATLTMGRGSAKTVFQTGLMEAMCHAIKALEEKVEKTSVSNGKVCKNCEFYRNFYGRGQCYGQKDAPYVDDNESCDDFKFKKSCANCKHMNNLIPAEPCFSCIHGLCDENTNRTEKWEAKNEMSI